LLHGIQGIDGVSNLNALSDGWRVLRTILVERYYYARQRTALAEHDSRAKLSGRRSVRELVGPRSVTLSRFEYARYRVFDVDCGAAARKD
jgi:hypothetical protein